MTKWALIFSVIYTLVSEPGGAWRYNQLYGWFNSEDECKAMAMSEQAAASKFGNPFIGSNDYRRMPVAKIEYECVTIVALKKFLKEKENVN